MIEIRRRTQPADTPTETAPEGTQKPAYSDAGQQAENGTPDGQAGLKRKIKAFTGIDSERDYRAMYAAAFDYHKAHNPPKDDIDYWAAAAHDIGIVAGKFDSDPFLVKLLSCIYLELENEYHKIFGKS